MVTRSRSLNENSSAWPSGCDCQELSWSLGDVQHFWDNGVVLRRSDRGLELLENGRIVQQWNVWNLLRDEEFRLACPASLETQKRRPYLLYYFKKRLQDPPPKKRTAHSQWVRKPKFAHEAWKFFLDTLELKFCAHLPFEPTLFSRDGKWLVVHFGDENVTQRFMTRASLDLETGQVSCLETWNVLTGGLVYVGRAGDVWCLSHTTSVGSENRTTGLTCYPDAGRRLPWRLNFRNQSYSVPREELQTKDGEKDYERTDSFLHRSYFSKVCELNGRPAIVSFWKGDLNDSAMETLSIRHFCVERGTLEQEDVWNYRSRHLFRSVWGSTHTRLDEIVFLCERLLAPERWPNPENPGICCGENQVWLTRWNTSRTALIALVQTVPSRRRKERPMQRWTISAPWTCPSLVQFCVQQLRMKIIELDERFPSELKQLVEETRLYGSWFQK